MARKPKRYKVFFYEKDMETDLPKSVFITANNKEEAIRKCKDMIRACTGKRVIKAVPQQVNKGVPIMDKWEYGRSMLDSGAIKSMTEWDDKREYAYSTMDRKYDYLWYEDSDGIHFCDRLYSYGITDEKVEQRIKDDELRLDFANIDEVIHWIEEKEIMILNKKEV